MDEFNLAVKELNFQSAQWFRLNYGETCRMCVQSEPGREFLSAMMNYLLMLQRSGQDFSVPLVVMTATMLQIGFNLGRKRAEAEILEGWMKL
ncbi:MAG TPA: hypothetical protein VMB85_17660 [Bryobacteraceae bacterium]|nr:hypothetical protein [Bryobacteraceae bacterium]